MNTLGLRIKKARDKLSQEAFSNLLKISKGSLGFYERDENLPNTNIVLKICSKTGVDINWLLLGEGPMYRGGTKRPQPKQKSVCLGYEPLEADNRELRTDLSKERDMNRELVTENRELNKENRQLWKENGDLRVKATELEMELTVAEMK